MGARFVLAIFLVFSVLRAIAQTSIGPYTIGGTVTDQSGASIPGAVISVRQRGSSSARTVTADQTGSFRITGLTTGAFEVEVSSAGFSPVKIPVTVSGRSPAALRVSLALAQVRQEMVV